MARSIPPSKNNRLPSGGVKKRHTTGSSTRRLGVLQPTLHPSAYLVHPSRFRLVLVCVVLLLGGLGLMVNLFWLQVVQSPMLQERARQQQMTYLRPFTPRRPIMDRLGNVLAIDQSAYTLYAHPILFRQSPEAIAAALAPLLDRKLDSILSQFAEGETGIRIEYALSEEQADQITQLEMDGLELLQHPQRLYPQQDLFGDVVGYINVDRQGQAGVEQSHETLLERSLPDEVLLKRTGDGSLIPNSLPDGFLHQDDLHLELSLDSRLQRAARYALSQQIAQFNAKRGAVLVMDVRDGSLLSMATEPSYDPNQYYKFDLERFRNWAVSDLIEPGSTFKPINVAIALETKAIGSNEMFEDEGSIEVGGWPIANYDYETRGGRGAQSVQDILRESSNVGMVHIVQRMEPSVYYNWLQKLGLGKPTGIDLPSEASSQMKSYEQFTGAVIEPATTAFGQGFSLTPLQLLQLHGALANGGKLVTPHLLRGLVHADGTLAQPPNLPAPQPLFSPQTTRTVLSMMESVVADGTGKPAQIQGYRIAGKTGTAQKASAEGGYDEHARITSFVGIFPVEAPRYAVLVVIDEPKGDDAYGSTVSAPIAKAVMEALITIDKLPPSQSFAGNEGVGG